MTIAVTHAKTSAIADSGDTTLVQPSDWNAGHTVTGLVAADMSDFSEAVDDRVATLLVGAIGTTVTYDDKANTLTVSADAIGSDTQIPFNDSGTMAGSAGFTFDKTGQILTLGLTDAAGTIKGPGADTTTSDGTSLSIIGSNGGSVSGSGGDIFITGGVPSDGIGGDVVISGGAPSGSVNISGGTASGASLDGGAININSGQATGSNQGGFLSLNAGAGGPTGDGGSFIMTGGTGGSTSGNGGNLMMVAGVANENGSGGNGGDLILELGVAVGAGTPGNLLIRNLPTSDPGVSGAIYNLAGVLMISA